MGLHACILVHISKNSFNNMPALKVSGGSRHSAWGPLWPNHVADRDIQLGRGNLISSQFLTSISSLEEAKVYSQTDGGMARFLGLPKVWITPTITGFSFAFCTQDARHC